jgi:hypothetical protein
MRSATVHVMKGKKHKVCNSPSNEGKKNTRSATFHVMKGKNTRSATFHLMKGKT